MEYFEIDDELLNYFHQPLSFKDSLSYEDAQLSMRQRMIISYDLLDLNGDYGFLQNFTQDEIHGYFSQMKKYSSASMNELIDSLDYSEHFHDSKIRGKLLQVLKDYSGNRVDEGVMIYHFALNPEKHEKADREAGIRNARIYFIIGKFGIVHVLFFDPFHEINP